MNMFQSTNCIFGSLNQTISIHKKVSKIEKKSKTAAKFSYSLSPLPSMKAHLTMEMALNRFKVSPILLEIHLISVIGF